LSVYIFVRCHVLYTYCIQYWCGRFGGHGPMGPFGGPEMFDDMGYGGYGCEYDGGMEE